MSTELIVKLRTTLTNHYPPFQGLPTIEVTDALESLGTCIAYIVAGLLPEQREGMLAVLDDGIAQGVARIVAERHPIVGNAIAVRRPK